MWQIYLKEMVAQIFIAKNKFSKINSESGEITLRQTKTIYNSELTMNMRRICICRGGGYIHVIKHTTYVQGYQGRSQDL